MTTHTTDAIMALADRYAFHIPGSQHSDEARAALLAALQEQAPKRLWGMAGFNPPLPNVGEKYTSIHEDDLGDHVTVTGIANASSPNIAYVFLSWDDGHYGERAIDEFWQEYMMVQTNDQAREGEAVANSAILARGRFHAFKGEDGEPDDWEWFEEGTNCEHGCIDAVIVRADAIAAPQPAQPESIECDCGRIHKKTRYGWACSEPAQPEQGPST